jgi:hypothetical protein
VWFGVLAAPLAWVAQLVTGYAVQEAGCAPAGMLPVLDADTEPVIAVISVAALAVAIAGAAASFVSWRSALADGGTDPRGRVAFMAGAGLLASVILATVIALGGVAFLFLDACRPA